MLLSVQSNVNQRRVGPFAWLVAALVAVIGATVAFASASGFMYAADEGAERLREVWPALLISILTGVATVLGVRAILRRRAASPWLLLGVVPAAVLTLNHAGVIG
jgi:hypothetical protein